MTRFAARRPAVCAALLTFITGCSTVAGQPTAQPALWDPCTIPSDAIAAAGVDPTIVDMGTFGADDSAWDECTFRQDWYYLTIHSTVVSFQEISADSRSTGREPAEINGRSGVKYRLSNDIPGESCYIAFPYALGSLVFNVQKAGNAALLGDACANAFHIVEALTDYLPD